MFIERATSRRFFLAPAERNVNQFLFSEQKRKSGGMPPFLTLRLPSQRLVLIDLLCKGDQFPKSVVAPKFFAPLGAKRL
jgi:hypothetical protein